MQYRFFLPGRMANKRGSAVIGRLRLGKTSVPTMALWWLISLLSWYRQSPAPFPVGNFTQLIIQHRVTFGDIRLTQGKASCGASSPGTERGIFSRTATVGEKAVTGVQPPDLTHKGLCVHRKFFLKANFVTFI